MIFLFADRDTLELGKVFSTLAMLGYVFNFSILYSNYALEAIYSIQTFQRRIKEVIEASFYKQKLSTTLVEATIIDDDYDPLATLRSMQLNSSRKSRIVDLDNPKKGYLQMEGIYAQWNVHEDKDTGEDIENEAAYSDGEHALKEVSFELANAEKVAVIGKVGSGKTSLLLTILKELCIVKGKLEVHSSQIAYVD